DRELGRLIARLKRTGLYERALLVVLSDHGVSFKAGGWRRPVSAANVGDVAPTALFVKRPGERGGRIDDAPVRTIDVLPTIADVLDVPLRGPVDGRSAYTRPRPTRRRIDVMTDSGVRIEVDPESLEHAKSATLARKLALFGSGDQRPGLFGIGPHPELLGRRLRHLPRAARSRSGTRAEIDAGELLRSVDRSASFVPTRITGRIVGQRASGRLDLAVALNGRVEALTRTYTTAGRPQFSALVPESALREGRNELELLAVSPGPDRVRLELLPTSS
ncbi:MAG: sulfatase-like hydrolase/transferase, partial [Thermoleophilaceae bacterium]|nr:sulfatase-like hydrolase/transferase [Thermoleophilaceae bacterium]